MYKLYPYVTNDASVGLFSPIADDIYHSVKGAATEAYTKFILPANIPKFLLNHNEIRVLDICYGIGYNTKSFLNFIFQLKSKNFLKNSKNLIKILSAYNYAIYDDNNYHGNNDTIYSDNASNYNSIKILHESLYQKFLNNDLKIYIKAIESDKTLSFLSPFIKSNIKKFPKNQFKNEKISKYLKNSKIKNSPQKSDNFSGKNAIESETIILPECLISYPVSLNMFLLDKLIKTHPEMLSDEDLSLTITSNLYDGYFAKEFTRLFEFYKFSGYKQTPYANLCSFLHNIYYKYLSERYKSDLKALKLRNIDFLLKINDARQELKSDASEYDFIFLDAFSPIKCPCLWSFDFFKLLYNHLSSDGMILTYSTSASVRNAFLNAGFFVGKTYDPFENKFTGTVAVKNKSLIKYELSECDLGLLKTKAGIFCRDENLNALNEAIVERRNLEAEKSNLQSSTEYKKQHPTA